MKCPRCHSKQYSKNGWQRGKQKYLCKACGRQWLTPISDRGYPKAVRLLCLRMYHNGFPAKDLERYTGISQTTILSWIKQAQVRESTASGHRHESGTESEDCSSGFITLL